MEEDEEEDAISVEDVASKICSKKFVEGKQAPSKYGREGRIYVNPVISVLNSFVPTFLWASNVRSFFSLVRSSSSACSRIPPFSHALMTAL
jgi:hypothetical protein